MNSQPREEKKKWWIYFIGGGVHVLWMQTWRGIHDILLPHVNQLVPQESVAYVQILGFSFLFYFFGVWR